MPLLTQDEKKLQELAKKLRYSELSIYRKRSLEIYERLSQRKKQCIDEIAINIIRKIPLHKRQKGNPEILITELQKLINFRYTNRQIDQMNLKSIQKEVLLITGIDI